MEEIARLQFYIHELTESITTYSSDRNNKKDIRQTIEIWKADALVASSIIDELLKNT